MTRSGLSVEEIAYGLEQAARMWNLKLHAELVSLGFNCLNSDRSIYIYVKGDVWIIMPIFMDDITLASSSQSAIDSTIKDLAAHFKLCDLGRTHLFSTGDPNHQRLL